jgi:hypothetical protein
MTQQLETQQAEQPRPSKLHGLYWALALLPFLYVLSIGPAAKLEDAGVLPESLVAAVYSPVGLIADHSKGFGKLMLWYLHDVWHCNME